MNSDFNQTLESALGKWENYVADLSACQGQNVNLQEVWNKHFPELPFTLFMQPLSETAKYIHKSYFKQTGESDIKHYKWQEVESIYSQMLIEGLVIGYYTFGIDNEDISKIPNFFEKTFGYLVNQDEEAIKDKLDILQKLEQADEVAFQVYPQLFGNVLDNTVKPGFSVEKHKPLLVRIFLFGFYLIATMKIS